MFALSYLRLALPVACLVAYQGVFAGNAASAPVVSDIAVNVSEADAQALERTAASLLRQMPTSSELQYERALLSVAEIQAGKLEQLPGDTSEAQYLQSIAGAAVEVLKTDGSRVRQDNSRAILFAAEAQMRNLDAPFASSLSQRRAAALLPQRAGEQRYSGTESDQAQILLAAVEALQVRENTPARGHARTSAGAREILQAAEQAIRGDILLAQSSESVAMLGAASQMARYSVSVSAKFPSVDSQALNRAAEAEIRQLNLAKIMVPAEAVPFDPVIDSDVGTGNTSGVLNEDIRQLQAQLAEMKAQHQRLLMAYEQHQAGSDREGVPIDKPRQPDTQPSAATGGGIQSEPVVSVDVAVSKSDGMPISYSIISDVTGISKTMPEVVTTGSDIKAEAGLITESKLPATNTDRGGEGAVSPASSYTVKRGDTLFSISRQIYGNPQQYTSIFRANRDQLQSYDDLRVGQVLSIPPE